MRGQWHNEAMWTESTMNVVHVLIIRTIGGRKCEHVHDSSVALTTFTYAAHVFHSLLTFSGGS